MMLKSLLKNTMAKLKPIQAYYSGIATIFMLHRVDSHDSSKLAANENMKVSPEFLEGFVKHLLDQGYDIISLDDLYAILIDQKPVSNKVVFTFDDGYRDNLTKALPIFEKYNIPFTIYITTSFPDRSAVLWWYALEDILLNNNIIELNDGTVYQCGDSIEKQKVFLILREKILKLDQINLLSTLEDLFQHYEINWALYLEDLALSWPQIANLAQHPLVTIGGHTLNHYAFNKLSTSQIVYEVREANRHLESMIGKPIDHFAYPFGSVNEVSETEYEVVKTLGLKTVTTTRRGNVFLEHVNHLESLPRVMLTNSFELSNMFVPTKSRVVTL